MCELEGKSWVDAVRWEDHCTAFAFAVDAGVAAVVHEPAVFVLVVGVPAGASVVVARWVDLGAAVGSIVTGGGVLAVGTDVVVEVVVAWIVRALAVVVVAVDVAAGVIAVVAR